MMSGTPVLNKCAPGQVYILIETNEQKTGISIFTMFTKNLIENLSTWATYDDKSPLWSDSHVISYLMSLLIVVHS